MGSKFNYSGLFLVFFLCASCVTVVHVPKSAISSNVENSRSFRIFISSLDVNEFNEVRARLGGFNILAGEITSNFNAGDICVGIRRVDRVEPVYKKIISVVTLSLYPYPRTFDLKIDISKCELRDSVLFSSFVAVTRKYGVLTPLSPSNLEGGDEIEAIGLASVILHGLGTIKN
jgi:hypothetical protein